MTNVNAVKRFDRENGLGTISFSSELVTSIIKKVLESYSTYKYISHSIKPAVDSYYEVSVELKSSNQGFDAKEIESMQKELMIVLKHSISLNCVLVLNIGYGK